jgi:hypothetical protein
MRRRSSESGCSHRFEKKTIDRAKSGSIQRRFAKRYNRRLNRRIGKEEAVMPRDCEEYICPICMTRTDDPWKWIGVEVDVLFTADKFGLGAGTAVLFEEDYVCSPKCFLQAMRMVVQRYENVKERD